jgi:hypothetical protein
MKQIQGESDRVAPLILFNHCFLLQIKIHELPVMFLVEWVCSSVDLHRELSCHMSARKKLARERDVWTGSSGATLNYLGFAREKLLVA